MVKLVDSRIHVAALQAFMQESLFGKAEVYVIDCNIFFACFGTQACFLWAQLAATVFFMAKMPLTLCMLVCWHCLATCYVVCSPYAPIVATALPMLLTNKCH